MDQRKKESRRAALKKARSTTLDAGDTDSGRARSAAAHNASGAARAARDDESRRVSTTTREGVSETAKTVFDLLARGHLTNHAAQAVLRAFSRDTPGQYTEPAMTLRRFPRLVALPPIGRLQARRMGVLESEKKPSLAPQERGVGAPRRRPHWVLQVPEPWLTFLRSGTINALIEWFIEPHFVVLAGPENGPGQPADPAPAGFGPGAIFEIVAAPNRPPKNDPGASGPSVRCPSPSSATSSAVSATSSDVSAKERAADAPAAPHSSWEKPPDPTPLPEYGEKIFSGEAAGEQPILFRVADRFSLRNIRMPSGQYASQFVSDSRRVCSVDGSPRRFGAVDGRTPEKGVVQCMWHPRNERGTIATPWACYVIAPHTVQKSITRASYYREFAEHGDGPQEKTHSSRWAAEYPKGDSPSELNLLRGMRVERVELPERVFEEAAQKRGAGERSRLQSIPEKESLP